MGIGNGYLSSTYQTVINTKQFGDNHSSPNYLVLNSFWCATVSYQIRFWDISLMIGAQQPTQQRGDIDPMLIMNTGCRHTNVFMYLIKYLESLSVFSG